MAQEAGKIKGTKKRCLPAEEMGGSGRNPAGGEQGWPTARVQGAVALWSSSGDGKRWNNLGSMRGCSW
jgi:hypothetical protein